MSNSAKTILISLTVFSVILFAGKILAQESDGNASQEIIMDEQVQAQDLGVGEPRILPDSPFYFLKNWGRQIELALTFDSVKKLELRSKFADQKITEIDKLARKTGNSQAIAKAAESYKEELDKIKEQSEKIKQKSSENPEVDKFLQKFIKQQVLQEKILQKLENQVPEQVIEKITEAREKHLEKFGEVMAKLEDRKEELSDKLEKSLEEIQGSEFKNFKNLEILKELENKVPQEAKEAIQNAQENALKRLKQNLEEMPLKNQQKLDDYLEKMSGQKENQLQILDDLKTKMITATATPQILKLKERLEKGKEKILNRIKNSSKEDESDSCGLQECPEEETTK